MGAEDADARRLAKVVDHPMRAKIIELLGERGPMGWKDLSTELGVKTGALYHHLDTLEGLVERDSSKKYHLTKTGMIVHSKTSQSHTFDAVQRAAAEIKREGEPRRLGIAVFVPRSLISSLTSSRTASVAALVALGGAFAVLAGYGGISPILYYLRPDPGLVPTVGGFAGSFAGVVATCYASARLVLRSSVDLVVLAAAAAFSFLPVFVASLAILLPVVSSFFASSSVAFTLFLVFVQAWSASILGAGLSVATGVRIERTLLVSLLILYATMVIMLVQGPKV